MVKNTSKRRKIMMALFRPALGFIKRVTDDGGVVESPNCITKANLTT